jgi:hypothetical protein
VPEAVWRRLKLRLTPAARLSDVDFVLYLFSHGWMAGRDDDLPFRVELWDDHDRHIEEVIALVSDYTTARSAYEEAVKRRPGKLITLRQKARVIQKSR